MTTPEELAPADEKALSRRRMLGFAGAGIAAAGAAVLTSESPASAAEGDTVTVGGDFTGTTATSLSIDGAEAAILGTNTATTAAIAGPANALKGVVTSATNGSHAVLGTTAGDGHAVAGVCTKIDNARGATWGRHLGLGAGAEGENTATNVPIAGAANGVKGVIVDATNGSHAVLGTTPGDGHAVAGVCTKLDNARGATWGRHLGAGAGVEGENTAQNIALAGPANGVKGLITQATNGSHAILGITAGAGHSVAGDTPAGSNVTAATWGRHGGAGAGIGGVSASGYGGEFVGGRASVRLIPSAGVAVGEPTDANSKRGELFVDGAGNLFYNVADGANFTRLNTQTVLFDDPQRAYDSRAGELPSSGAKGAFTAGTTKVVDLTTETDLPAGASGAIVNITVANTVGAGFVTVYNGDSANRPNTSSVNWSASGQILSNGLTVKVSSTGTVRVFANSGTHVIIDVIGFIV